MKSTTITVVLVVPWAINVPSAQAQGVNCTQHLGQNVAFPEGLLSEVMSLGSAFPD